jgi:hypothetical protein
MDDVSRTVDNTWTKSRVFAIIQANCRVPLQHLATKDGTAAVLMLNKADDIGQLKCIRDNETTN